MAIWLIVLFLYATIPAFDLHFLTIFNGVETPYIQQTFFVGAGILAVFVIFRAVQRWMAIRFVRKSTQFLWLQPVTQKRVSRVRLYLFLENLHFPLFGIFFFAISPETVIVGLVCFAAFFETLLFLLVNARQKKMKCGITSQAIVICDREAKIFYFSGLRKITLVQEAIYMEYKEELTMDFSLDCVLETERASFVDCVKKQINLERIFLSDGFKNLS